MTPSEFVEYIVEGYYQLTYTYQWVFYIGLWISIEIIFLIQWLLYRSIVKIIRFFKERKKNE